MELIQAIRLRESLGKRQANCAHGEEYNWWDIISETKSEQLLLRISVVCFRGSVLL